MKLKLTQDGHAVVRNGMPVYVHANGREEAFDAPAAMKLAVGKHFEMSKVASGLSIPHQVAAAAFGDSFRIEKGELVAYTGDIPVYSHTRHGEAANFEEALGQLIDHYPNKSMILREAGAQREAPPAQQGKAGSTITRAQFDSLAPAGRAKFVKEGGRIDDVASSGALPNSSAPSAGGKTITRAQFDVMGQFDRAAAIRGGATVVD